VKENQPALYQDIKDYFDDIDEQAGVAAGDCWTGELENDHGRIERRNVTVITDVDWLEGKGKWKDVKRIIRYRCWRTIGEQTTITDRYYISSTTAPAETMGGYLRRHWSIENQLHWSLDVLFREDASQARKDKAPQNWNVLRKIALARLRATAVLEKRFSTKRKIFKASVNPEFLYSVLFGK
jgi:predicted transposase YbfD/YdcC